MKKKKLKKIIKEFGIKEWYNELKAAANQIEEMNKEHKRGKLIKEAIDISNDILKGMGYSIGIPFDKAQLLTNEMDHSIQFKIKPEYDVLKVAIKQIEEAADYAPNSIRYDMCQEQPVQLDCRNDGCKYHRNAACINESPAITIINDKVTCWSKDDKK